MKNRSVLCIKVIAPHVYRILKAFSYSHVCVREHWKSTSRVRLCVPFVAALRLGKLSLFGIALSAPSRLSASGKFCFKTFRMKEKKQQSSDQHMWTIFFLFCSFCLIWLSYQAYAIWLWLRHVSICFAWEQAKWLAKTIAIFSELLTYKVRHFLARIQTAHKFDRSRQFSMPNSV